MNRHGHETGSAETGYNAPVPGPEVLFVSKPVAPPWNDGSKTVVRDLAGALERYVPVVLGRSGGGWAPPRGRVLPAFPADPGHALDPGTAARLLSRLALRADGAIFHFFFQPNLRTSLAARALGAARRKPTVHTALSLPPSGADLRGLFFADRTIVVSRMAEARLRAAGVPGVVRIPPAVGELPAPTPAERLEARRGFELPADRPLVVFPGDLEHGAALCVEALPAVPDAILALACRPKSPGSRQLEAELRSRASALGVADRVRWIGQTDRIHALLGAADVVALASVELGAKVDLPVVLVEAMWLERTVLVARGSCAAELAAEGGALEVEPRADALAARLAELLGDEARRARLGQLARVTASMRYSPEEVAPLYEALYDAVLA